MTEQNALFKNAPIKDGIPSKDWKDYFQSACLIIGTTEEQLNNADHLFTHSAECAGQMPCSYALDLKHEPELIHVGLLKSDKPTAKWIVPEKIRLSELILKTGMLTSKNEIRRKMEQKGLLYNDKPFTKDIEIDLTIPSISHEVRFGKRFLEIIVPVQHESTEDA